jgi:cell division protein FtsZ
MGIQGGMQAGLQARMAEPVAQQSSNITALRQQSAQPERVIIPDPMPYPEESIVAQPASIRTPRFDPVPLPRQPSSLFAHSPATTATETVPAQSHGAPATRSLFQTATGLFRKRATAVLAPEAQVRRMEPLAMEPAYAAPAGMQMGADLTMEAERPPERRLTALDDGGLDIPAFLRRQSS